MIAIANRLTFQFCVALAAAVPVAGGMWGAVNGLGDANSWSTSHYRYLSGLLLAIGLGFWSTLPHIERRTQRFRLLTAIVFAGGLCRLLGVVLGDPLTPAVVATLALELLAAPLLCLWQSRISITDIGSSI